MISCLIVLSLLVLLTLAIAFHSKKLSTKSQQELSELHARSNAKLALHVALSELQQYCGNDRSTTCRADLLDTRDSVDSKSDRNILHPHYTVAFQTQAIDKEHKTYGRGVFLRRPMGLPAYLVSGNEFHSLLDPTLTDYPNRYTTATTRLDPQHSVSLSSKTNNSPAVRVPLVNEPSGGRYAYWVGDENLKARINLPHAPSKTQAVAKHTSQQAPTSLGVTISPPLSKLTNAEQYHTLKSFQLLGKEAHKQIPSSKHDLTVHSSSVLSDMKHGGLKKNLTAALNKEDKAFQKLLHAKKSDPQSPIFLFNKWVYPSDSDTFSYSHYPSAPWELFRSYLRRPELEPQLNSHNPTALSHLGSSAHQLPNYWQHRAQKNKPPHPLDARLVRRSPVILRVQLGIDYSAEYLGTVNDPEIGHLCHEFQLRQHFIPLVSFWNPYNVELEVAETIEFHTYLDRNWSSGRFNTHFTVDYPKHATWRIFGLHLDSKREKPSWSPKLKGAGSFFYPYHPSGNATKKSILSRCSFHVPPFRIAAGKTALFSVGSTNHLYKLKKTQTNKLQRLLDSRQINHSFYTKHSKLRISTASFSNYLDAIPLLEINSFPSSEGKTRTRLHVTNASSFQRINWNFSQITQRAAIRFLPTLIDEKAPLPESDINGTESPKLSSVLIRKFANIQHYQPHSESLWKTPTGGTNTNPYLASWALFHHHNASRYGAYGAHPLYADSFSSPPQYLSGVLLGSNPILTPDLNLTADSYVGHSDRSSTGSTRVIQHSLPHSDIRTFSPAHFGQINLTKWLSNYNADQSNASATDALIPSISLGNSFCPPHIPPTRSAIEVHDRHAYANDTTSTQYDTSFRYNEALWDRYFFTGELPSSLPSTSDIHEKRQARHLKPLESITIDSWNDPHRAASHLMLEGGFNINSTSVEAWKMLLASTLRHSSHKNESTTAVSFPRSLALKSTGYKSAPTSTDDPSLYDGSMHRELSPTEIEALAKHIVRQNKLRGPYLSLSQFINRSLNPEHHYRKSHNKLTLETHDVCYTGAIQAAINAAKINGPFHTNTVTYPSALTTTEDDFDGFSAGKINPKALTYHAGYGAPGTLTQADILSRIGHRLTARSDTFTIRAYGDSVDSKGRVRSKAYCEAVVQRVPEYFDSSNSPETPPFLWKSTTQHTHSPRGEEIENPNLSELNRKFGRRFKIIHFRWLSPSEI